MLFRSGVVAAVTDIASVRDGVVTAGTQIASTRNAATPAAMATKSFFMHLIMPPMRDFRREANQKIPHKHFLPCPVFLKSFWHWCEQFTMQILPVQQIKTSCQKPPCQEGQHALRYYRRPIQSDMRRAHCPPAPPLEYSLAAPTAGRRPGPRPGRRQPPGPLRPPWHPQPPEALRNQGWHRFFSSHSERRLGRCSLIPTGE